MSANYFAIDIGGACLKWGLVSPGMVLLQQGKIPAGFSSADELCATCERLVAPHASHVAGIGVSVPGVIHEDDAQGTVYGRGDLAYLDGFPLGAELSFRTSLPVTVENDGKACALGEYAAGALRGVDLGVVMVLGTGIGGGIVSGGRVVRGAHDFAGEFSFLRTTPFEGDFREEDIMAGTCGWPALKRAILTAKGMLDMGDIDELGAFDWVLRGDPDALRGLHEYAKRFCMWILNLQCVIDPEVFAIGGGISAQPALIEALQTTMRTMMADLPLKQIPEPKIVGCEYGNDANLLGAAYEAHRRK